MKSLTGICLSILLLGNLSIIRLQAQVEPTPGVYLIFDASGSMWGKLLDGSLKIQTAREVLVQFLADAFPGKEIALRVYGHRREGDCRDSELLVPFGPAEQVRAQLEQTLLSIRPKGRTPISYSLRQALADFGERSGDIILISDGIETCDEDPCALMREWQARQVGIKVHVVGFGVEEKARLALQCMAEAAGTPYRDAGSADELVKGLSQIQKQAKRTVLRIYGKDAQGNPQRVRGWLEQNGTQIQAVKSHFQHDVAVGTYTLVVGVETQDGSLFELSRKEVNLLAEQDNRVEMEVSLPPRVYASFWQQGERRQGALVYAYQAGKELFTFRPKDTVFVQPGTYEFRSKPNEENELSKQETLLPNNMKEIVFQLVHTVRARIRLMPTEGEKPYGSTYELWQNGERKYKVNHSRGWTVLPGVYDVKLVNRLTPLTFPDITITEEAYQQIDLSVPSGWVSFHYLKADGSPDKDDRVFLSPADGNTHIYHRGGVPHPFPPGEYRVDGWRFKGEGTYKSVRFTVEAGQHQKIFLRPE